MSYIATTLRPGFLVALSTSITGNVKYRKEVIEADTLNKETGALHAKWQTEREVKNAAEQEAATKVRSKVRTIVSSPCSLSSFGLLCPDAAKPDLDKAVAEARALVDAFNATATTTRLKVSILSGKIAPDDVEAIKAINTEITGLLNDMQNGLQKLDIDAVRAAASRAKQMGQMLNASAQAQIQIAIDAVRKTAKKITEAGDTGAKEIDRATITAITEARTAFLDLDEAAALQAPTVKGRGVDFEPGTATISQGVPGREIEIAA